jgi:hypothetical protein
MKKSMRSRRMAVHSIALAAVFLLTSSSPLWSAEPADATTVASQNNLKKTGAANDSALKGAAKQKALLEKTKTSRNKGAKTGTRGYDGDASGIVGSTNNSSAHLKAKGAEAFKNAGKANTTKQAAGQDLTKSPGPIISAKTSAIEGQIEIYKNQHEQGAAQKEASRTREKSSHNNLIGGPPVGTAVGKAIGNSANDGDESEAEKKGETTGGRASQTATPKPNN